MPTIENRKLMHDWNLTPSEAIALQRELAPRVRAEPLEGPVKTVAGIDVSIQRDEAQAAVSVLTLPELDLLEYTVHRADVPFPYVPGLLSFREVPVILPALEKLRNMPDVLMTDSQGLAHPRRFGLASHLGVLLDWPTLGVAKTRLTGTFEEPGPEKGARSLLTDGEKVIGAVVRTRANVKPVFVSVGHRITLEEAINLTLTCSPRYKIPEPTRQAHRLSRG